jgi:class 3 adenylate cyclase
MDARRNGATAMTKFRPADKAFLEKIFEMESGYVLNFTDQTFALFFSESLGVDIDDPVYFEAGGSKAKRLRRFFQLSDAALAARALRALWAHREATRALLGKEEAMVGAGARLKEIAQELEMENPTSEDTPATGSMPLDLVRSKTRGEFAAMDRTHERALNAIVAAAAAKGSLRSGGTLRALGKQVEHELHERAQIALDTTRRVLIAQPEDARELAKQARLLVETIVESNYAVLSQQLFRMVPFAELNATNPGAIRSIEFALGTVRRNEIDRALAEIDLVALEISGSAHAVAKPEQTRIVATVLFTDIVDSTAKAAAVGDIQWQQRMRDHGGIVDRLLQRFSGHLVKTTGDGILATFKLPGDGIRCALQMVSDLRDIDLSIKAGLHMGELDDDGNDVIGLAVNMAQRIMSAAGDNKVFVSSVVAGAIVGSSIKVEDRGEATLKGFAGKARLFEALPSSAR